MNHSQLRKSAHEICSQNQTFQRHIAIARTENQRLVKGLRHCFDGYYSKALLHTGYGLPVKNTPIVVTNQLEDYRKRNPKPHHNNTSAFQSNNTSAFQTSDLTFAFGAMLYKLFQMGEGNHRPSKECGDITPDMIEEDLKRDNRMNLKIIQQLQAKTHTTLIFLVIFSFFIFILIMSNLAVGMKLYQSKQNKASMVKGGKRKEKKKTHSTNHSITTTASQKSSCTDEEISTEERVGQIELGKLLPYDSDESTPKSFCASQISI